MLSPNRKRQTFCCCHFLCGDHEMEAITQSLTHVLKLLCVISAPISTKWNCKNICHWSDKPLTIGQVNVTVPMSSFNERQCLGESTCPLNTHISFNQFIRKTVTQSQYSSLHPCLHLYFSTNGILVLVDINLFLLSISFLWHLQTDEQYAVPQRPFKEQANLDDFGLRSLIVHKSSLDCGYVAPELSFLNQPGCSFWNLLCSCWHSAVQRVVLLFSGSSTHTHIL